MRQPKVGDTVHIKGWRFEGSLDKRTVTEVKYKQLCDGGIMIRLDYPLKNGSTLVSAQWAHEYKRK